MYMKLYIDICACMCMRVCMCMCDETTKGIMRMEEEILGEVGSGEGNGYDVIRKQKGRLPEQWLSTCRSHPFGGHMPGILNIRYPHCYSWQ